jgi:magnesium-transporting ATPase (P-type)
VLALATKRVEPSSDLESEALRGGYRLIGLVAMRDPPRPEVSEAVAKCRQAGLRIIVVSGDHPLTVEAIARETGAPAVCTGRDPAGWSEAGARRSAPTTSSSRAPARNRPPGLRHRTAAGRGLARARAVCPGRDPPIRRI